MLQCFPFFLSFLLLAGCDARTEIVVVVESDLGVPGEVDRVEVELGGMGRSPRTTTALLDAENTFPQQLLVQYSGDGSLGPYTLTARATLAGAPVVEASQPFTFRAGERTIETIRLSAACRGVMCPPGESCVDGACVRDPERDAGIDAGSFDAGPFDAGSFDAGPPGVACATTCRTCGGDCADIALDPAHCGACDASCSAGETCVGGSCAGCTGGLEICAGQCVDLTTAYDHCGACGSRCRDDEHCDGSACQPAPVGGRCAIPFELGVGTFTVGEGAAFEVGTQQRFGDGHVVPCLVGDRVKTSTAVRFVAPSDGTLTITFRTLDQGGPILEVFADADTRCECPLADRCVFDFAEPGTVSLDVAVRAGEGVRMVLSLTKERDAELTLALAP